MKYHHNNFAHQLHIQAPCFSTALLQLFIPYNLRLSHFLWLFILIPFDNHINQFIIFLWLYLWIYLCFFYRTWTFTTIIHLVFVIHSTTISFTSIAQSTSITFVWGIYPFNNSHYLVHYLFWHIFFYSIQYTLQRIYNLFSIFCGFIFLFSWVPLYYTGVLHPVQVMLNHLLWFKMAFTIFSFVYIMQLNSWHESFQDFFPCFTFNSISLHSERYYPLDIFFW